LLRSGTLFQVLGSKRYVVRRGVVFLSTGGMTRCSGLFLSCCFAGAMALGAAFRVPGSSVTGFWMFMFFVCLFLGLLIGQLAVYSVHRERITKT
jgi:hypothetical protein